MFKGYPLGAIHPPRPDDRLVSKVTATVIPGENEELAVVVRSCSETEDVRLSAAIGEQVLAFFEQHGVTSVVMTDRIIGCPHEEGIDYIGPTCPRCPFWAGRDRFTHEIVH